MLGINSVIDIKQPEYLEDATMRRTASILMNVNAIEIPTSIIPEDTLSRIDFACAAISIRMQYDHMPMSPMNLFLSLCQSKIDIAVKHKTETDDQVDYLDALNVIFVLSNILRIPGPSVGFKANLISPQWQYSNTMDTYS
jgi:hypothetical protein